MTYSRAQRPIVAVIAGLVLLLAVATPASARVIFSDSRFTSETVAMLPPFTPVGLAFAPDGRTFASASSNGMIKLWDGETAAKKKILWGGKVLHALAYTPDSKWRNRAEFINGRAEIEAFLRRKWARELDYRLIKELWTFAGDRPAHISLR